MSTAYALREVPLSDSPRTRLRLSPRFAERYLGSFTVGSGGVVGLHVHHTWQLAKEIVEDDSVLVLEHEPWNEHDSNAVAAYLVGPAGRELVGHLDADTAAQVAPELSIGAPIRAKASGHPYAGKHAKGGTLPVHLYLDED